MGQAVGKYAENPVIMQSLRGKPAIHADALSAFVPHFAEKHNASKPGMKALVR